MGTDQSACLMRVLPVVPLAETGIRAHNVRSGVDTSRFKGTQQQLEALVGL